MLYSFNNNSVLKGEYYVKKGINAWSFAAGTPAVECIKIAKSAGYDGLELAFDESGEVSLESSEKELRAIKNAAADEGIELPSLASGLYWNFPFTSDDKSVAEKAKCIAKKQLEAAAILGADTILIVPGTVGADFIPGSKVVSYDAAYDRALEAMEELKTYAKKLKVSIGIENVWNKFLLSPLEMRDFIDKVGSDYVGSYLDVGNVVYTGYPEQWIRILGSRIKKVHLKDFRKSVGTLDGFVDLLAGDVNFPEVVKALNEIKYTGYVTAEMGGYTYYKDQLIYSTSASMDRILGRK